MRALWRRANRWLITHVPQLAVLRPLSMLGWIVVGWGAAPLVIKAVGVSAQETHDTARYMLAWGALAMAVCIRWIISQWRERAALPASCKMSLAWSPAVAALIIAALLGSAYAVGYPNDRALRAQTQGLDVNRDARTLSIILGADIDRSELLCGPNVEGVLRSYASERAVSEGRKGCPSAMVPGDPGHPQLVRLFEKVRSNMRNIARAQGCCAETIPSWDPNWFLTILCLSALFATVASLAGIVRISVVAVTGAVMWLAVFATQVLEAPLQRAFDLDSPLAIATSWKHLAWPVYVAAVVATMAYLVYRRQRTPLRDGAVTACLLGPFLVLAVQWSLFSKAFILLPRGAAQPQVIEQAQAHHDYVKWVLAIWWLACASTWWLVARYRSLPKAR